MLPLILINTATPSKAAGKSKLMEMLDPYPSALEIVYGEDMRPDPEAEEPPEFVAAPDPYELIEGMYGKPQES